MSHIDGLNKSEQVFVNSDHSDPDTMVMEYIAIDGRNYVIDFSWYALAKPMLESLDQLRWSNISTIWLSAKKLVKAILGQRINSHSDNPFRQYASADPTPEKYGSSFRAKNPLVGSGYTERHSTEESFLEYLEEKQELEWNRLQNALATGGIYMYGGSP